MHGFGTPYRTPSAKVHLAYACVCMCVRARVQGVPTLYVHVTVSLIPPLHSQCLLKMCNLRTTLPLCLSLHSSVTHLFPGNNSNTQGRYKAIYLKTIFKTLPNLKVHTTCTCTIHIPYIVIYSRKDCFLKRLF